MLYSTEFYKKTSGSMAIISSSIVIFLFIIVYSPVLYSESKYIKCWKNSDGVTECGNKIPRKYYNQKVRFIDDRGMTRKIKEKSKTREERLAAAKLEEKKSKELALENEKKNILKEHQDILLKTYLNIDALLSSMHSKLDIVNSQSSLLETSLPEKKQKFAGLIEKAADSERSSMEIPAQLMAQLTAARSEINNTQNQIILSDKKIQQIKQTFSHDTERFILLKSRQITQRHASRTKVNYSTQSIQAVQLDCNSQNQCNDYWKKAAKFIKNFSTTAVLFETPKMSVSGIPLKHEDIAMALALLETDQADKKIILLQIRCNNEKQGQQFCSTDKVSNLLPEFKKIMEKEASRLTQL